MSEWYYLNGLWNTTFVSKLNLGFGHAVSLTHMKIPLGIIKGYRYVRHSELSGAIPKSCVQSEFLYVLSTVLGSPRTYHLDIFLVCGMGFGACHVTVLMGSKQLSLMCLYFVLFLHIYLILCYRHKLML